MASMDGTAGVVGGYSTSISVAVPEKKLALRARPVPDSISIMPREQLSGFIDIRGRHCFEPFFGIFDCLFHQFVSDRCVT
jgi:hypothetical protein